MDEFNQVGKKLRKNKKDTEQNTRRIAENFPQIERKVDYFVFDHPYEMEFMLSDHPHSVKLDLLVRPPENCFQCTTGPSSSGVECVAIDGVASTVDGNAHPIIYGGFSRNSGGFVLNGGGGVIVPQDGIYNCVFTGEIVGLTTTITDAVIASVRKNGVIIQQIVYSVANGKLGIPFTRVDIGLNTWGLCIACRAGDVIGGWLAAAIGFYDPNQLGATITLVGLG